MIDIKNFPAGITSTKAKTVLEEMKASSKYQLNIPTKIEPVLKIYDTKEVEEVEFINIYNKSQKNNQMIQPTDLIPILEQSDSF